MLLDIQMLVDSWENVKTLQKMMHVKMMHVKHPFPDNDSNVLFIVNAEQEY